MQRRRFIGCLGAGATVAGGAGFWLSVSQQRAARWARRLAADARRSIQPSPLKPEPNAWSDNKITVSWLGHATVLINFYGIRILTDPALGSRVGVSLGFGTVGPKRYIAPALQPRELPPIDLVLLSHAHMDHMDLPTLQHLRSAGLTVTASDTADVLSGIGLKNIRELRWGEHVSFSAKGRDLQIEAVEVRHWGERWPSEKPRGYNGYILEREGKKILFGGDTALTPAFAQTKSRGPFEIALMPIGAYRPWIWNHCTPEQALEMANAAGARYIVPIHHQTFRLSEEPQYEPIERLKAALSKEPERLALSQIGQSFQLPA